jgi:hypothetical protein
MPLSSLIAIAILKLFLFYQEIFTLPSGLVAVISFLFEKTELLKEGL